MSRCDTVCSDFNNHSQRSDGTPGIKGNVAEDAQDGLRFKLEL